MAHTHPNQNFLLILITGINIIFFLLDSEPEVKNPLNETESSLTTKDAVEKKENFRYG